MQRGECRSLVVVLGLVLGVGCAGQHVPVDATPTESFEAPEPRESTNPVVPRPRVAPPEAHEPLAEESAK
ncbi:MAG: hypothetical protein OXT09_16445, partial [Myxococcales bacterium]|nr:hypothetical protein [Myxococcales bacterium]